MIFQYIYMQWRCSITENILLTKVKFEQSYTFCEILNVEKTCSFPCKTILYFAMISNFFLALRICLNAFINLNI